MQLFSDLKAYLSEFEISSLIIKPKGIAVSISRKILFALISNLIEFRLILYDW